MKVLILCGVFAKENTSEVVGYARRAVEFSANLFQEKLIRGFRAVYPEVEVLSAPFIGSYPNASKIRFFDRFSQENNAGYHYVSFNNLWGLRNLSRTVSLKKGLSDFIAKDDDQKLIVVYSAHTPFLAAAAYAKQKDPRVKVCLYVPDLPQYMNLSVNRSWLYDIAKKADIASMFWHMKRVDAFVLLTEQMKELLPVGGKPCLIREGIMETVQISERKEPDVKERYIVYTGKLDQAFGILDLIEAFVQLPSPDYRLVLCGRGDCETAASAAAEKDKRILCLGQVSPEEARAWQQKASVLVNPRQDNEEYTKYSFPSKTIEYLLTGNPVVAYRLRGMPVVYEEFLCSVEAQLPPVAGLAQAMERAIQEDRVFRQKSYQSFVAYAQSHLDAKQIAREILHLCLK